MRSESSNGMTKNIVIIGAGISGLSLLYFLRKKYAGRSDVRITLLEKSGHAGGNIRTHSEEGALFEWGPNGFLSNQPVMLDLINELGLSGELTTARAQAKRRYILVNGVLHAFPLGPGGLIKFRPMTLRQKLRIFLEPFVAKGNDSQESLHGFVKRRFGLACAQYFADPMVSGIYGGNSEHLNAQAAFPKICEFEQTSGSVIKGMIASRKKSNGSLKTELRSFKGGMGTLIKALADACAQSVRLNEMVKEIIPASPYYLVVTDQDKYPADELYIATPAFAAAELIKHFDRDLTLALSAIEYAPIAVVGLLFEKTAFQSIPDGFGYLIPSSQNNKVLGVLAESNIFEGRAPKPQIMLRVMIGGARHPDCAKMGQDELTKMALDELNERFGLTQPPTAKFFVNYAKAIPQYETQYPLLKKKILQHLTALKGLFLFSNYLDGVSSNDCVKNAQLMASRSDM